MKNWFYRNDIWLVVGGWVLVVFPAILFVGMTVMVARTELQDYRKTLRKSDAHAMREVGRVAACLERTGSSAAERAALRNACLFEQLPATARRFAGSRISPAGNVSQIWNPLTMGRC